MAVTPVIPSGLTNGRNAKIVAIATPGTLFHTADATAKDEVFMWLTNTDTVDREVTVEAGGVTAPDDHQKYTVPAKDTILAIPGVRYTGGVAIRAFCAAAANVINMFGNVNRYT